MRALKPVSQITEGVRNSWRLLGHHDRRRFLGGTLLQSSLAILDLAGVLLIGLAGLLAAQYLSDSSPALGIPRLERVLPRATQETLLVVTAAIAGTLLLAKSALSPLITRRIYSFLAGRQADVSRELLARLLLEPLTFLRKRTSQELAYALNAGVQSATLIVLGQSATIAAEFVLLVLLGSMLAVIDPVLTIGATIYFATVGTLLHKVMGKWAGSIGRESAQASIDAIDLIQQVSGTYRENFLAGRHHYYVEAFGRLKRRAGHLDADRLFVQQFPKYVFEAALVFGAALLAGSFLMAGNAMTAVGVIALFVAAGTRIMPSLLRLQAALVVLREAIGAAQPTYQLAEDVNRRCVPQAGEEAPPRSEFRADVKARQVSVHYEGAKANALDGIDLQVRDGEAVGIVGPSGAGKSTLVDVLLGIIDPTHGEVSIAGLPPRRAIAAWPGRVAYVPQDVLVIADSVRRNVALGLEDSLINDDQVWLALERAHLDTHFRSQSDGLDTQVGERGFQLSGGQRQRLGLARALYSQPQLLVLDEATSALDAETEETIATMLSDLRPNTTSITIAHRLSTLRSLDRLYYIDDGRVVASGSFTELRKVVPAFDLQAKLMGL